MTKQPWRRSDWVLFTLRVLVGLLFIYEGIDKFSERRMWIRIFDEIGFGQWFRYLTGIVELAGGLMLLMRRTTILGVALLACTMIGAILVHVLVIGVGPQTVVVSLLLLLLGVIGKRALSRDGARLPTERDADVRAPERQS